MSTTMGYENDHLVLRVPMALAGFHAGRGRGARALLDKLAALVPEKMVEHARKTTADADEISALISRLIADKDALRPEPGVQGLVAHKRKIASMEEELEAAHEVHTGLRAVADSAMKIIVANLGGRANSQRLETPDGVSVVLEKISGIVRDHAETLGEHLGAVEGFTVAIRQFDGHEVAEAVVAGVAR